MAECSWRIVDGHIEVEAVVPANTTASVILPNRTEECIQVGSGTYSWSYRYGSEAAPLTRSRSGTT